MRSLLTEVCPTRQLRSRESLYEDDNLPAETRDTAALLASKVYYFLGEYDEALSFALGAGSAFENETRVFGSEEYVETVVCEFRFPLPPLRTVKPVG